MDLLGRRKSSELGFCGGGSVNVRIVVCADSLEIEEGLYPERHLAGVAMVRIVTCVNEAAASVWDVVVVDLAFARAVSCQQLHPSAQSLLDAVLPVVVLPPSGLHISDVALRHFDVHRSQSAPVVVAIVESTPSDKTPYSAVNTTAATPAKLRSYLLAAAAFEEVLEWFLPC